MPYRQQPRARIRQALPATSTSGVGLGGGELRRALRHQRVLLADPDGALPAHVDDDLAPGAEWIGQRAGVAHRDGLVAGPIPYPEVSRVAALRVARDDLPGQLVRPPGPGVLEQLAGRLRLAGGREARVREGARQQDGGAQRHDEANPALAARVHLHGLWRASMSGPRKGP